MHTRTPTPLDPMPDALEPWPRSVALTGADWFICASDARMRRRLGAGTVCHLVLTLDRPILASELAERLAHDPAWGWIARLRLTGNPPWSAPRWSFDAGLPLPEVVSVDGRLLQGDAPSLPVGVPVLMDPRTDAMVRLAVSEDPRCPAVVLSWHHALLDARGAELLIARLASDAPHGPPQPVTLPVPSLPHRLYDARRARDAVWNASVGSVAWTPTTPPSSRTVWRRLVIEGDDLDAVQRTAEAEGGAVLRSVWHLVVISGAVDRWMRARGVDGHDLLVTVPQDGRRRGDGVPISNMLSLLFYRVSRASLADPAVAVRQIGEGLRELVRARTPTTLLTLLDLCRVLPASLYATIVGLPTRGRTATFGFSDTGDTLAKLTTFADRTVTAAHHLPANLQPPGLTFVVTQLVGGLHLTCAWRDGLLSEDEATVLLADLRAGLTGRGR